jgi:flagellar protein FlaG
MEVNPAPTPRPQASGQSAAGSAKATAAAASDPNPGPAAQPAPAQAATPMASDGQTSGAGAEGAQSEDLKKAETLRALIGDKNMQLRTYHDEASGHSVLEVSDQATGKVVSQYPSDELLRLYAALREPLVDQRA